MPRRPIRRSIDRTSGRCREEGHGPSLAVSFAFERVASLEVVRVSIKSMVRIKRVGRAPEDAPSRPDDLASSAASAPTVTVYAEDCILVGELVQNGHRRLDPLTEWMPLLLRDIATMAIADGQGTTLAELSVPPDEIVAVSMASPPAEYGSTRRSRVTLRAGPYFIEGSITSLPATDPIASLRRRSRIELTQAVIEYRTAGRPRRDLVPALSVNWYLVESMAEADETLSTVN